MAAVVTMLLIYHGYKKYDWWWFNWKSIRLVHLVFS